MTTRRPAGRPVWARRVRSVLVVLVLLASIAAGAAPGAAAAGADAASQGPAVPAVGVAAAQVDADDVLLAVDLRPDGSAAWRVEYRLRLDDENATGAFEELQADVASNRSAYTSRFADRMAPTVAEAESATGREMALRNVSVRTSTEQLPQRYGVLTYTFEWTNFAAVEGDRLRAGGALAGLFLDAETSLLVSWPEGYRVVQVTPEPTEEREASVLWRGPTDFGPGEPTLVVSAGGGPGGLDPSLLGLVVLALVLVGGGLLWWRRAGGGPPERPGGDAAAGTGGRDGEPAGPSDGGAESTPTEALLSNEERVLALLEERGGRMKQQEVVQALGWTDAKTSQVVGKLRDSGQVEGFRLGRENVLRLPEVDESPAERAGLDDEAGDGDPTEDPGGGNDG